MIKAYSLREMIDREKGREKRDVKRETGKDS